MECTEEQGHLRQLSKAVENRSFPGLLWKMPATFWPDLPSLMMQFAAALTPPLTGGLRAETQVRSDLLALVLAMSSPSPHRDYYKLHGFLTPPTPITLPLLSEDNFVLPSSLRETLTLSFLSCLFTPPPRFTYASSFPSCFCL